MMWANDEEVCYTLIINNLDPWTSPEIQAYYLERVGGEHILTTSLLECDGLEGIPGIRITATGQ